VREKQEKKLKNLFEKNREWIQQALKNGAIVSGKYLVDPKTKGRLELDHHNMALLNEIKGEGKPQSQAMMGNQNATGPHEVDTAAEFNAKYNKHVSPEALPVWKATQWDGSIDRSKLSEQDKKYLETSGNYVQAADGKWYDIVNFASGNIYDKLDQLENDRKRLTLDVYERQKKIL
jgi:hypothetical protein